MTGRTLVLTVIAVLVGGAAWTLATRKPKGESSRFKPWYPEK